MIIALDKSSMWRIIALHSSQAVVIVPAQVLPGLVYPPSCYITGDGLNLGSCLELPAALTAVVPELGSTLDFQTREAPDRMEITVVTADVWGNQVAAGGANIQAELYKFTDKAPPPDVTEESSEGSESESDATDHANVGNFAISNEAKVDHLAVMELPTHPTASVGAVSHDNLSSTSAMRAEELVSGIRNTAFAAFDEAVTAPAVILSDRAPAGVSSRAATAIASDIKSSPDASSPSTMEASIQLPPIVSAEGAAVTAEPVLDWYPVGPMANVKVMDNRDGSYTVAYTVHTSGRYKLEVNLRVSIFIVTVPGTGAFLQVKCSEYFCGITHILQFSFSWLLGLCLAATID